MTPGTLLTPSSLYKIGEKYIQLARANGTFDVNESPEKKFGASPNTWELLYANEGITFQNEGYNGEGRTNGLMQNQIQGFRLNIPIGGYDYGGGASGYNMGGNGHWFGYNAYQPISATPLGGHQYITTGAHGAIKVGTRTAHRNRLIRVWRRIL